GRGAGRPRRVVDGVADVRLGRPGAGKPGGSPVSRGLQAALVAVGVGGAVELAQARGDGVAGRLRLPGGVVPRPRRTAAAHSGVLVTALVVLVVLLNLLADRPDRNAGAQADETARAAEGEAAQVLDAQGVDLDVLVGRHVAV